MGCFGRCSKKPKGNYSNPAYNFSTDPPQLASLNDTPQKLAPVVNTPTYPPPSASWNSPSEPPQGLSQPVASNFRPEGLVSDGKGALPDYTNTNTQWTPGPPPGSSQPQGYSGYNSNLKTEKQGFRTPPAAFAPSAAGDDYNLPPPPAISHDVSPASNTTSDLADAGYNFCVMNPLSPPQQLPQSALLQLSSNIPLPLASPPGHFRGKITTYGRTTIETANKGGCPDTCLISALPLFCAGYHHPANTGRARHIYFEVTLQTLPHDATVAIGFVGCPYPSFRLPGWNRGSLGVHSDDGRRYCNDSYGGKDFTEIFRVGERVGIGMKFPTAASGHGVEVFFSRNGVPAGGWRLDEETDAELDWPATEGLDGANDVYAAIGVWGSEIRVEINNFYSREE